jgi:hypothetical protein
VRVLLRPAPGLAGRRAPEAVPPRRPAGPTPPRPPEEQALASENRRLPHLRHQHPLTRRRAGGEADPGPHGPKSVKAGSSLL